MPSRLTEREIARLIDRVRETLPEDAMRLEQHLEASESEESFLDLFERCIVVIAESTQCLGSARDLMASNRDVTNQVNVLLAEIVRTKDDANAIEREKLELERQQQASDTEYERKKEEQGLSHTREMERLRVEHEQALQSTRQGNLFKILGGVVTGGAATQLVSWLIASAGG